MNMSSQQRRERVRGKLPESNIAPSYVIINRYLIVIFLDNRMRGYQYRPTAGEPRKNYLAYRSLEERFAGSEDEIPSPSTEAEALEKSGFAEKTGSM